jgi:bacterioferritin-associated ferredoxin
MYLCLCMHVTADQIRAAYEDGCCDMAGLRKRLGVSTGPDCGRCGTCVHLFVAALYQEKADSAHAGQNRKK